MDETASGRAGLSPRRLEALADGIFAIAMTLLVLRDLRLSAGEADVLRLHRSGGVDLVVSDDRRFLQILDALGIAYATPGPLIAAFCRMGQVQRKEAFELLENLAAFISEDEYSEAKRAIEEA